MKFHATLCQDLNFEIVAYEDVKRVKPHNSITVAELFRRQSQGLPIDAPFRRDSGVAEGTTIEEARSEYYRLTRQIESVQQQQVASVVDTPPPDGAA